jgi:hypothetical protein
MNSHSFVSTLDTRDPSCFRMDMAHCSLAHDRHERSKPRTPPSAGFHGRSSTSSSHPPTPLVGLWPRTNSQQSPPHRLSLNCAGHRLGRLPATPPTPILTDSRPTCTQCSARSHVRKSGNAECRHLPSACACPSLGTLVRHRWLLLLQEVCDPVLCCALPPPGVEAEKASKCRKFRGPPTSSSRAPTCLEGWSREATTNTSRHLGYHWSRLVHTLVH